MSQPFNVLQGDITLQADLAEPAFASLRDATPIFQALYGDLARFGLRVADMKVERGSGSFGEAHLLCSLLNYATNIRVRVERTEIACWDSLRLSQESFVDIARTTLEAVSRCIAKNPYKFYTLSVNLHGSVQGTATRDYLTKFAPAAPKNLGPPLGSGIVLYYGAEAERVTSFVTLDLSGLRADAVYLRAHIVWDAGKVTLGDLPAVAEKYFRAIFDGIGLDWPPQPAK